MDHVERSQGGTEALLKKLHERPQMPLGDWLRAPAHVHYKAFRMSDPPTERPASWSEFQSVLGSFKVPAESIVLKETFGLEPISKLKGDILSAITYARRKRIAHDIPKDSAIYSWISPITRSGALIEKRF